MADAQEVCTLLRQGTDPNDLGPRIRTTDLIDDAAFAVEAITFYCPGQMAGFTDGRYATPVQRRQRENCPKNPSQIRVTSRLTWHEAQGEADYSVTVRNDSQFDAIVAIEKQLHGKPLSDFTEPYSGNWYAEDKNPIRVSAQSSETITGTQRGAYRWTKVDVRVIRDFYLFLNCGYEPGLGPT